MSEEEKDRKSELLKATWDLNWRKIKEILEKDKNLLTEALLDTGDTILHIAVEMGQPDFVEKLLLFIQEKKIRIDQQNEDGSTVLHVAVSAGNKHAMKLLVDKHKELLTIQDANNQNPLIKAFNDMQYDIFIYLLKKSEELDFSQDKETGARLLVNAITAKQYSTALELIDMFPKFAVENDEVLVAIARNFPSELNYWETLICPLSLRFRLDISIFLFHPSVWWWMPWRRTLSIMGGHLHLVLRVPVFTYFWMCGLVRILIWMVLFPLSLPYLLLWKVLARLVPPIKHIEKKIKVLKEAEKVLHKVLKLVCGQIDPNERDIKSWYNEPILEAAIQNADSVFRGIVFRSREAIKSKHENGYNIFQLAVINRSEKIYNLLYIIGEDKNLYRTLEDSSGNNMLHLAGRLAPSHVLKRRTGAALQLQRELQWFKELKKFMHPSAITKQNIFGETPPQVFTREHENLVKEGEKWMKTTAESCSISAALITTIVFAAAITVPGGSNPETGLPMFRKDIAFTIFAISDAISLFTSSSSLMVFLSILTARFAEQDFLFSLPKRLFIGLCTLLLSVTTMMVAFGATLYLLFCREKPWMLGPICGFAFLPILFFVTLQFPLIADLYRSTYVPIFH